MEYLNSPSFGAYILLTILLFLSIISRNKSVIYAVILSLIIKIIDYEPLTTIVGKDGLNWGIILLTAGILTPLALGKITMRDVLKTLKTKIGIFALVMGLIVAILGKYGLILLQDSPNVVATLILGTLVGVFLCRGVAAGPLIAGGIATVIMSIYHFISIFLSL